MRENKIVRIKFTIDSYKYIYSIISTESKYIKIMKTKEYYSLFFGLFYV